MADRAALITDFLNRSGWGGNAKCAPPLAGDASARRYERLSQGGGDIAVLMDAPPGGDIRPPFTRVARHLSSLGLSAPPTILAEDTGHGLLLIEDFGDGLYARLMEAAPPSCEEALYIEAVEVLITLHAHPPAPPSWLRISAPPPP